MEDTSWRTYYEKCPNYLNTEECLLVESIYNEDFFNQDFDKQINTIFIINQNNGSSSEDLLRYVNSFINLK